MNASEQELLELAAKVGGINLTFNYDEESFGLPYAISEYGGSRYWNPLVDDGDALQLAAHIGAEIKTHCVPMYVEDKPYVTVKVAHWVADTGELIRLELHEEYTQNQMQAIRTAIVRMATELGKKVAPKQ